MVVWGNGTVGIDLDKVAGVTEKFLVADIKKDAAKGLSGDDTALPPLTEDYAKRKAKAGKGGAANFKLSGKLLRAIKQRGRKRNKKGWIVVTISVANKRFRQMVGLAGGGRRLLGVSKADVRELIAKIDAVPVLKKTPGKPPVA